MCAAVMSKRPGASGTLALLKNKFPFSHPIFRPSSPAPQSQNPKNISNIHFALLRGQACNVAAPWTDVHFAFQHYNHVPAEFFILLNRRDQIWPKSGREKCEFVIAQHLTVY